MGWFIFLEEPGDHQLAFPYGVLAGIAIEDRHVWPLARKLKDAEFQFFGRKVEQLHPSFAVDKALSAEMVRLGNSAAPLSASIRTNLAVEYFSDDRSFSSEHTVAAAQSYFGFCHHGISLLKDFDAKAFAILMPSDEFNTFSDDRLRKDYVLLFERVSYFLASQPNDPVGLLISSGSHSAENPRNNSSLIDYFEKATKGRQRSRLIIPEPVSAGTSLATISNAALILSFIVSSGFRLPKMTRPRRLDLDPLLKICNAMRFSFTSDTGLKEWSFRYIESLKLGSEPAGNGPMRR